jgi:hypothetical protein
MIGTSDDCCMLPSSFKRRNSNNIRGELEGMYIKASEKNRSVTEKSTFLIRQQISCIGQGKFDKVVIFNTGGWYSLHI